MDVLAVMERNGFSCGDPASEISQARAYVAALIYALSFLRDESLPYADGRLSERLGEARTFATALLAQVSA